MATEQDFDFETANHDYEESGSEAASSRLAAEAESGATNTASEKAGGGKASSASFEDLYTNELKKTDLLSETSKLKDISGLKILEKKEVPLSRTEQLMVKNVTSALDSGKVEAVQEMLATLSENPEMVNRVMGAVRDAMGNRNFLNHVSWEQGKDSHGRSFVRMHLFQADSASKSSGGTEVTIGSDGRNSANYTKRWDSPPSPMDPAAALGHIMAPLKKLEERDFIQYKK